MTGGVLMANYKYMMSAGDVARVKSCFMELRKVQQELYTVKEENADSKWKCKEIKEKQRYQKEQYIMNVGIRI